MDFLLDTHALIWFLNGDKNLPEKIKKIIEDENNTCYVSIASLWEMAIKISKGNRLLLNVEFDEIDHAIAELNIGIIPIETSHLRIISLLKFYPNHKDPFDRIIIAQAKTEKLPLISLDKEFKKYGVKLLWD